MKRVLVWALVLILCLGMFAGCGKEEASTPATTAETAVATQAPTEPAATEPVDDSKAIHDALEFLKTFYRNVDKVTPSDFKRISNIPVKGVKYPITWTVNVDESLVKVVPADESQVLIDVNENSEEEVTYELTATISNAKGESVSYTWEHVLPKVASLEDMQEIVKAAYALEKGQSMEYAVTLRGEITSIKTPYDPSYKNITVVIVVEGCEDMPIEAYRLKGDGCEDLRIGDIITVTGKLKNYNGTIEFDAGCTLDSVIKGEAVEAPEDPKQIVDEAYALGANQSLKYEATLTGTIITVSTPYDANYKNVTVIMEIEGRESKPIQCYRLKGEGADKIGINDIITVKGYITNYVGSKGYSTIQFTAGCQLISWEDRETPEQPSDPKQVVDEAYALGANKSLKYEATLTGRVTKVKTAYDPNYGNVSVEFVVEGRENKPILAYRMKGNGVDKLGIGDIITVKGFITNYVGDAGYSTIEYTAGCQLLSYVKNTAVAPTDSLQIVKEAYQLGAGKQLPYEATVTGKITKVNTPYDSGYKNVTVTIVVEGGEDMPIKCYRLKGTNADKIGVGDVITVKGYIENYQHSSGDTEVEFTAGCQLVGWVDDGTGAPETPDVPATPGSTALKNGDKVVIFAPAYKKALSADKVDASSFYNKGVDVTVSGNTVTGYGNAEIWTVIANADGTYSFANGGKNIGLGAEFSSLNLGEVNDDWKVISLGGSLYNVQNIGRGNFIEWYASKNNWSTYNSNRAATDDQFQLSFFVIGTGILAEEKPDTPVVPDEPTTGVELVTAPVAGTAYKFGMVQEKKNDGLIYFIDGAMSSYYMNTVTDTAAAADVYLEATNGGYYLYTMLGGTKTYINMVVSGTHVNGAYEATASTVYTYDADLKTVVATVNDTLYKFGTRNDNTYTTVGPVKVELNGFHCQFYTVGSGSTTPDVPVVPDEPTADIEMVTAPTAGTAYKLYMNKTSDGKILYFNGTTESASVTYRLATTENADEAVDVYLEAVSGGYALYFMDDAGAKTYIRIYERDAAAGKGSLEFVTAAPAEVLTYNSEFNTLFYTSEATGNSYYMGTYSTYVTFSVSNSSFINGENLDISQFPAHFGLGGAGGSTTPDEPTPDDPNPEPTPGSAELVTAPEAGTAYKLGMDFEGAIHYIDGGTGSRDYYLSTTTDASEAVDVYLEEEAGCYFLYFMNGNTKTYIRVYEYDPENHKGSLQLTTEKPVESYTFDETTNTLFSVDEDGEDTYYMGTYFSATINGIYDTVSTSNISYITGENAEKVGVSQFPVHLYTVQAGGGTVTPEPEQPNPEPTGTTAGLMVDLPVADDVVIIYNSGMAMTATDNGGKLAGETAAVANNLLNVTTTMAQLTVVKEGDYYLFVCGGKYLTSAPTGNGLTLESELTDLGRWTIRALDGTNAWIIKNVGANYNGNYNQAMETYNGNFTTYGEKETEIYQMQLYKVGGAAPEVTPPAGGGTTPEPDDEEPVTPPPADTTGEYRKIEKVADLTAGTYLIAAYAESYNDTDFSANPWHFWGGQITTGTNNDLVTNTYAYANGSLTKHTDAAVNASKNGDAVAIELVAVDGKANTYYIKLGDLYLSSNGAAKRKLQLTATPAEWVAVDFENGGIVLNQYFGSDFATIGFANAASNMIRGYKNSGENINTGIKGGLYFFAEN